MHASVAAVCAARSHALHGPRAPSQLAERTISDDLEYLIEKAVNPAAADYAVITGVEIHNWAAHLEEGGEPSMEFIAPSKAYVVVNGVKTHLDLMMVPVSSSSRPDGAACGLWRAGGRSWRRQWIGSER
jgi:hypothetical protein